MVVCFRHNGKDDEDENNENIDVVVTVVVIVRIVIDNRVVWWWKWLQWFTTIKVWNNEDENDDNTNIVGTIAGGDGQDRSQSCAIVKTIILPMSAMNSTWWKWEYSACKHCKCTTTWGMSVGKQLCKSVLHTVWNIAFVAIDALVDAVRSARFENLILWPLWPSSEVWSGHTAEYQ